MDDSLTHLVQRFNASEARPKYRRLQMLLFELIRDGILPEGTRLPPDNELARKLGVSLGTVQQALTGLTADGVLTRAPRRGTVVAGVTVAADQIYVFRFRELGSDTLIRPQVRMLSITRESRPGPWRAHFGTADLVRFERLLRIALEPPVYSEVFAPMTIAHDLLDMDPAALNGASLHQALEIRSGKPFLRSRQFVHMAPLCEVACSHLLLDPGSTGLIWDIAGSSFDTAPVTFQRIQLPQTHCAIEFDVELDLGTRPLTTEVNNRQSAANKEKTP